MTPRLSALLASLLATLLLVAGCGGSSNSQPPAQRLAAAKAKLDKTPGVRIKLATPSLPRGVNGVLSATGTGTKAPAFTGTISVVQNGLSIAVPVIAVNGKTYVKIGTWSAIDPAKFGAPDPAQLFASGGLSTLLDKVSGLKSGGDTRNGSQILSTFTGTVPGSAAASILPSASKAKSFKATFLLDGSDTLVKAVITGAFYAGSPDVTYNIDFSDYGAHPDIKPPAGA